jgi:DtxR family transcriptional regulator, Mn-dependent transcriptional regulator
MSSTEQKYLRAIYQIRQAKFVEKVSLNELALYLDLSPPTVFERVQKLKTLKLLSYSRSKGIQLSPSGTLAALLVIRNHRIWETFLHKICKFSWSEVHDLAEELQKITSEKLMDRLYELSGEPRFDPHGDPIPDKTGLMPVLHRRSLSKSVEGCRCQVLGVNEDSPEFLNYLTDLQIGLDTKLQVEKIFKYDGSLMLRLKQNERAVISPTVAERILVTCSKPNCKCRFLH